MHTRKPVIAAAAVFGVVIVLLAGTMFTLETRWFSGFISDRLSKSMGQEVRWEGPLHIDWSLTPTIRIDQFRVDNPEWANHDNIAQADSISAKLALPKLFQGLIAIEHLQVERPSVHLLSTAEHGSNWSFLISEEEKKSEPLLKPQFGEILLAEGTLTFVDQELETDITATANSPDGNSLRITGDGQLLGEPLRLRLTGDPLQDVLKREVDISEGEPEGAYELRGNLDWQEHSLQLAGTTASLTTVEELHFDLQLEGPDTQQLLQFWNPEVASAPYQLKAEMAHQQNDWLLQSLTGHVGDSEFEGMATYHTDTERPKLVAEMQISAINLDAVLPQNREATPESSTQKNKRGSWRENMNQSLAPLREYDAELSLRVERLQKGQTLVQNLQASAELTDGELTLNTFEFDAGDGHVTLDGHIQAAQDPATASAELNLEEVNLGQALAGFGLPTLGKIDGEITSELTEQALLLNSDLRYWDKASKTDVQAQVRSGGSDQEKQALEIDANGRVNDQSLEFAFTGGPLLQLDDADKTYPLKARLSFAETEFTVDGTADQPLLFDSADLNIHAEGPDPAQVQQLTGISIPQMPAYQLDAHLLREDQSWYLRDIRGELGESDLTGNLRWAQGDNQRLMVWADLHSRRINVDQLTSAGSEQPGDSDEAEETTEEEQEQVLPEEKIARNPLQDFDARILYAAENVTASGVPLDDIKLEMNLNQGQLEVAPLSFGVGGGTVRTDLYADANASPISGRTDLEISKVSINDVLSPFELASDSFGRLGGQGEFKFTGRSIAQALANLEGEMHLAMTDGRLDATLVEALGMDAGEIFFSLFGEEPDPVDIQCAYVKLNATSGAVDIHPFTIATADSNILGDGEVNFEDESLEFVIEAKPKDFSVISGSSPLRVHGTFSNLQLDVVSDELLARGALTALGAAVFPPAALLPLVELGDNEGQNGCEQDVKSAESSVATQ